MSHTHHEAANEILRVLGAPGAWITRSRLIDACRYNGKNETTFGQTLHELINAGLVEENRIPKQPTQYARTSKAMPAATPAPRQAPLKRVTPEELKAARQRGSAAAVKARGIDIEITMQRRARIIALLEKETLLSSEIFAVVGGKRSDLSNDLTWLRTKGYIVWTMAPERGGNVYSLTGKSFDVPPAAADAPAVTAAVPARAPIAAAAPAGAADDHEGAFTRARAMDHEAIYISLQDAHNRALDAREVYLRSCTNLTLMKSLDGSIEAAKAALDIFAQLRSA